MAVKKLANNYFNCYNNCMRWILNPFGFIIMCESQKSGNVRLVFLTN